MMDPIHRLPRARVAVHATADSATRDGVTPQHNRLLAALPATIQGRLFPTLQSVALAPGLVLHEPGEVIQHIYFPTRAVVSRIYLMEDGASAGVAVVGNDGLVGVGHFMGGGSMLHRAVVHCAGHAYRGSVMRVKDEVERHGELFQLILRYLQAMVLQTAQTVICNRYHSIDQQICRLLLQMFDRLPVDALDMTQEVSASILGVRRESVTQAVVTLRGLGVIKCNRGRITLLDRAQLEALSCECYGIVRREAERLLPRPAGFIGGPDAVSDAPLRRRA